MRRASLLVMGLLAIVAVACAGDGSPDPSGPTEDSDTTTTTLAATTTTTLAATTTVPSTTSTTTTTLPDTNEPFREDFDGVLDAAWKWLNEDLDRWTIADGWLEVIADDPPLVSESPEIPQVNLLTRALPDGLDFAVSTKLVADPVENFEQASLAVLVDGDTYVAVNLGFCEPCTGRSFYLEGANDGVPLWEGSRSLQVDEDTVEVWLRIEHSPSGDATVVFVATEEGQWQRPWPVIRGLPDLEFFAIGAANAPGPGADPDQDLIARFDWVEVEVYE